MIRLYLSQYQHAQEQSKAGIALLDLILKSEYHKKLSELEILHNEMGKPYFSNYDLHFNLTHSGGFVVLALSDRPVGVDIEAIRPIRREIGIRYLGVDTTDKMELVRAWTKRESYGKMTGEGFHIQDFSEPHFFHEYRIEGLCDDFILTVCSPENDFPEKIEKIKILI